ncbi:MAG: response regulator [Proteobacteria bacterium]|nr:response regulator [Pseudomonadota bacterium]
MTDVSQLMVVDSASVSRALIVRGLRTSIEGAKITACASAAEALTTGAARRAIFAVGVTDYFDKARGYPALAPFIAAMMQHHFSLKGRVLYVEDSPTSARVICSLLQNYGLGVVHMPDAEQALELLRSAAPFDLVLTDYLLTGQMTGGDLVRAIRAELRYSPQALPVLVITGQSDGQVLAEVLEAGSNDVVTKPIVAGPFMARVRSLLLIRQQYQALRRLQERV